MFPRLYEYMRCHKGLTWTSFSLITLGLVVLMLRQTYKEDISDFLPLDSKYVMAMDVYQQISGAERIVVLFQNNDSVNADPDEIVQSIDFFMDNLLENDTLGIARDVISQIDIEQYSQLSDFIYENIPFFLTEDDYNRIDSLMLDNSFVEEQIARDKQMLMFPVAGFFSENMQKDPLSLFAPVFERLRKNQINANYDTYDGYIFSEDMKQAIISVTSIFGASETENNSRLVELLTSVAQTTMDNNKNVSIRLLGGPVIAVGNAQQIKADSILSVIIAVVLILILLLSVFRNFRSIFLIIISVAWGWLFAMGGMALVHDHVSVIVIGISSVIIGIAVNYPLHLIAHLNHTPDIKTALKEIVTPLVVGNVTTVGAFMALIPLKSVALRDLGLFSSLLLVGTIVFVIIFLPHLVKINKRPHENKWLNAVAEFSLEKKMWIVCIVLCLTILFTFFCFRTSFDPNMRNINFMTEQQKQDMALFQQYFAEDSTFQKIFVVSSDDSPEKAFEKSYEICHRVREMKSDSSIVNISTCTDVIALGECQDSRLHRWRQFVEKYGEFLESSIRDIAKKEDFSSDSFNDFFNILHNSYNQKSIEDFDALTSSVFESNIIKDNETGETNVVDIITVDKNKIHCVSSDIEKLADGQIVFDVDSMSSAIATNLSDDFNYIGWACGLIVFVFLWISFGSLELAILSFLPMAISWIWILGIMALVGIKFNMVNVILATFIFGQGDDYTIFMTEGCQFEYARRKKMLASYKGSIIISALIMFIGIGSLVFARHPALHSLAEVTIVGMFSVVLMAYLFPPLVFKWLVSWRGRYRQRPISLSYLVCKVMRKKHSSVDNCTILDNENTSCFCKFVADRYRYKGFEIYNSVKRNLKKINAFSPQLFNDMPDVSSIVVINAGWGELPLHMALSYPDKQVFAYEEDVDKMTVAYYAAENIVDNIHFGVEVSTLTNILPKDSLEHSPSDTALFIINPTDDDKQYFSTYNPQFIYL